MIRFLAAVAQALAKMMSTAWHYTTMPINWLDNFLFGGGAGGTVMPDKHVLLPQADEVEVSRYQAKSEAKAKDAVDTWSAAHQVRMYAIAPAEDKYLMDISLLSTEQKFWLQRLSDTDLRVVAEADDKLLNRALAGEDRVLRGIYSVGCEPRPIDNKIAERIATWRSMAAERDHVFTA